MNLQIVAVLLVFCAAISGCEKGAPSEVDLPKLATVPEFSLLDENGKEFSEQNMNGHVWAVNFFFTSCPTMCPALSAKMKQLQDDSAKKTGYRIASFSVDPRVDTPQKLNAYSKRFDADPKTWSFITGDTDVIKNIVVEGFKVAMGPKKEMPMGAYDIVHATHVVLVDRHRRIRGYYRSDAEGLKKLRHDARELVASNE